MRQSICLVITLFVASLAHAEFIDDLTSMDDLEASKKKLANKSGEFDRKMSAILPQAAAKKYKEAAAAREGKNGQELLNSMRSDIAAKRAGMSLARRKNADAFHQKFSDEQKKIEAASVGVPMEMRLEKMKERLDGLAIGNRRHEGSTTSPSQTAYHEHLKKVILKKYGNVEQSEKNRKRTEDANMYLKSVIARQADYGVLWKASAYSADSTKGPTLPLEGMKSNWLVQQMAKQDASALQPKAEYLPKGSQEMVKKQIENVSLQLRTNTTISPAVRYNENARIDPMMAGSSDPKVYGGGKYQELINNAQKWVAELGKASGRPPDYPNTSTLQVETKPAAAAMPQATAIPSAKAGDALDVVRKVPSIPGL